ncbi:MAG: GNAT family N-acetyltransferase [Thermoflexaceae bacterium]|nr:GNAT family N-acetyltransferase [Thermoflexaceae bacterium]
MEEKSVTIRTAVVKDAEKLLEIYAPYVENTAVTFEYEVPLKEEFEKRIQRTLERYPYLVAESDGEILGYAYAGSFHERPAYDWAVETSIYVNQNKKRMGIGRTLHEALENVLKEQNVLNMNACIAYIEKGDEYLTRDSVIFHTHMGYRMVGEFYECGYKFKRWYNMVWMEKHIGKHVEDQPGIREFSKVREIIAEKYNIR